MERTSNPPKTRKKRVVSLICPDCKRERFVSPQRAHDANKKGRLFCGSCAGKRMSEHPDFKHRKWSAWNKGKKTDPEVLARTIEARKGKMPSGEKNKMWKGDEASYFAKHIWLKTQFGRAQKCEECGATREERMIHWANISDQYLRKREDWKQLCVPHHSRFDRNKKLK